MNQLKKNSLFYLSVVLIGIISFQVYSLVSAQSQPWTQPPGAPPMSNVASPLDTSNVIQLKKGSLTISADGVPDGNGGVSTGHAIDFLVSGSQPASIVFDAGATWTALQYDDATKYFTVTNPNGPLFLSDRTLGLRLPNIATSSATAVSGNVIFDPTSKSLQLYNGTSWGLVSSGGAGVSGGQAGYLPLWQSATILATSSVFQDVSGKIGINTKVPQTTLSVQGNISLLRQPGTNITPGWGPTIVLQSPSTDTSMTLGDAVQCVKTGSTCTGPDNVVRSDDTGTNTEDPKLDCTGLTIGRPYTDIYTYSYTQTGGAVVTVYKYQTILCAAGTSQYSIGTNDGALEFVNNKNSQPQMILDQSGNLEIAGNLKVDGTILGFWNGADWLPDGVLGTTSAQGQGQGEPAFSGELSVRNGKLWAKITSSFIPVNRSTPNGYKEAQWDGSIQTIWSCGYNGTQVCKGGTPWTEKAVIGMSGPDGSPLNFSDARPQLCLISWNANPTSDNKPIISCISAHETTPNPNPTAPGGTRTGGSQRATR